VELKLEINEPRMIVMSCDMFGKLCGVIFFGWDGDMRKILMQGCSWDTSMVDLSSKCNILLDFDRFNSRKFKFCCQISEKVPKPEKVTAFLTVAMIFKK
jgi:hypothetical protein